MCKAHDIAREVVGEFIEKGEPFRIGKLYAEIKRRGGLLRIAPNYTVEDYLEVLELDGEVKRVGTKYIPLKVERT